MKLLVGLYSTYSGNISINSCNIKNINERQLHQNVGIVMQDSILFNMTIEENLRLADPKASMEDIYRVCQDTYIHDEIINMQHGYNTVIGEKGNQLSGGQKQRIAIARVLLTKPKVIIFDEATASLDSQTEKLIHKTICNLKKKCTIIIIAHRASSILLSDRVILMNEGKIEAEGGYKDLLNNNKLFNTLFEAQLLGVTTSM